MAAWKQTISIIIWSLIGAFCLPVIAMAAQSSSNNFQVNEVFFGSGGELRSCGTDFCSKQSAGELVVGNTKGDQFQAQGGFNSDRTPYIQFNVGNTNVDLGTLNATSTKTATATFTVKAYLAHGYSVINASDPPSNNSYIMASPTGLAVPSSAGTEQFGINLRANTSPTTFGADLVQSPNATFGFGQVAGFYNIPNNYKYLKGDAVAISTSSSSDTTYTVSYIFNVSNVTPGGTYVLRHVLVATGTY